MAGGDEYSGQAGLALWARAARVRSAAFAAQAVQAAESAAASSDQVDRMIQRMAERNPVIQLPFRWPQSTRDARAEPPVPPPIVQLGGGTRRR